MFVRGSLNEWALGHEMKFDAVENESVAYVELTPGGYEFKIASEDWSTVDLGFADDGIVQLGVPEPITAVTSNNLYLEVAEPGVYATAPSTTPSTTRAWLTTSTASAKAAR